MHMDKPNFCTLTCVNENSIILSNFYYKRRRNSVVFQNQTQSNYDYFGTIHQRRRGAYRTERSMHALIMMSGIVIITEIISRRQPMLSHVLRRNIRREGKVCHVCH